MTKRTIVRPRPDSGFDILESTPAPGTWLRLGVVYVDEHGEATLWSTHRIRPPRRLTRLSVVETARVLHTMAEKVRA